MTSTHNLYMPEYAQYELITEITLLFVILIIYT